VVLKEELKRGRGIIENRKWKIENGKWKVEDCGVSWSM
jgi:hypothetical protein